MRFMNHLLRNVNLLNTILTIFIIMLFSYMVYPLLGLNVKLILPAVKKTMVDSEKEAIQSQVPSPSDYSIIAEQNIFHSERKIPVVKSDEKAITPKPDIVLYGTLITDETSLAYIEDKKSPQITPGRGKRQTVLKKGDTFGGYAIKTIEADKIVMIREDDTMIVYLYDPQKPKTRESLASAIPPPPAPQQPAHTPVQTPAAQQRQAVKEPAPPAEKQALPQEKVDDAKKAFFDFLKK